MRLSGGVWLIWLSLDAVARHWRVECFRMDTVRPVWLLKKGPPGSVRLQSSRPPPEGFSSEHSVLPSFLLIGPLRRMTSEQFVLNRLRETRHARLAILASIVSKGATPGVLAFATNSFRLNSIIPDSHTISEVAAAHESPFDSISESFFFHDLSRAVSLGFSESITTLALSQNFLITVGMFAVVELAILFTVASREVHVMPGDYLTQTALFPSLEMTSPLVSAMSLELWLGRVAMLYLMVGR